MYRDSKRITRGFMLLFLSLSLIFFPLPSSLGGAFVCLAKPVFDRAGLRAAISGPRAPSSLLTSSPPRPSYPVRHLQRFKLAALSGTLGRPFFPRELVGRKIFPRPGVGTAGGKATASAAHSKNRQKKVYLHYETLSFFTSDLISSPRPFWGITMRGAPPLGEN